MYIIYYRVPYEGLTDVHLGTLEEVKDWLKTHQSSYDWNLDNVEVTVNSPTINVYELMRD